jgi:hypothetical protein
VTSWKCKNPSCPDREPTQAETAPRCYTCGQSMSVLEVFRRADLLTPARSGEIEEVHEAIVSLQNYMASAYAVPSYLPTPYPSVWNALIDDIRRGH